MMDSTLEELVNEELLRLKDDGSYEPTQLGQAIVASAFSPEDGAFVYEELTRALQAFVMDGEMHVFYMFTPLQVALSTDIDWPTFRDQVDNLDESGVRALQFVGVNPGFVNAMYVFNPSLFCRVGRILTAVQGPEWSLTEGKYSCSDQTGPDLQACLYSFPAPRSMQ